MAGIETPLPDGNQGDNFTDQQSTSAYTNTFLKSLHVPNQSVDSHSNFENIRLENYQSVDTQNSHAHGNNWSSKVLAFRLHFIKTRLVVV